MITGKTTMLVYSASINKVFRLAAAAIVEMTVFYVKPNTNFYEGPSLIVGKTRKQVQIVPQRLFANLFVKLYATSMLTLPNNRTRVVDNANSVYLWDDDGGKVDNAHYDHATRSYFRSSPRSVTQASMAINVDVHKQSRTDDIALARMQVCFTHKRALFRCH